MSARLLPGRLLFSGLRGTGGAARFGVTVVAGAVFLETVFTEWSEGSYFIFTQGTLF